MLGYDLVVVMLGCCGWLVSPLEALFSPQRPEAVNEALLQPMKGRVVAIDVGPAYFEAGMADPAGEIASSLAASLANRYGLRFEPGRAPSPDMLVLGVHTLEWTVDPAWKDYELRYRGEATLVDRKSGRRLGRAWCDRRTPTGKDSHDAAFADRPALAAALRVAADSCLQQFREGLLAEAIPR